MEQLIGLVFGRLTITADAGKSITGLRKIQCQCVCGNVITAHAAAVKSGHTKSCGCLSRETVIKRNTKHGHSNSRSISPTYNTWRGMIDRCYSTNHAAYKHYGGRGVTVCDRWHTFSEFLADMGQRPQGAYSIDRIDVYGNYEPSNCRWASSDEQKQNTTKTIYLTVNGVTKPLMEFSRETGIPRKVLRDRVVKLGWAHEKAVTVKVLHRNPALSEG